MLLYRPLKYDLRLLSFFSKQNLYCNMLVTPFHQSLFDYSHHPSSFVLSLHSFSQQQFKYFVKNRLNYTDLPVIHLVLFQKGHPPSVSVNRFLFLFTFSPLSFNSFASQFAHTNFPLRNAPCGLASYKQKWAGRETTKGEQRSF